MNLSKRKSQVTLFIIIGLIMLFFVIFLIYNSHDAKNFFRDESEKQVYDYVLECYKDLTYKGIKEIGLHGGWLYTPERYNFANKDTFNLLVPDADGITDIGGVNLVYWYYYDDGDEAFKLRTPNFNDENDEYSIRNQLNRYINEHIEDCINRFSPFKKEYKVYYNPRDLKVKVSFINHNIFVSSNFNLRLKNKATNKSSFFNEFRFKTFNYLERPYYHALAIILADYNNSFIDKRVWDFLVQYQTSKNRKELPPTADVKFNKFDLEPWIVDDVKKVMKLILESNLPLITFLHSSDTPVKPPASIEDNELAKGIYDSLYKDFIDYRNNYVVKRVEDIARDFDEDSVKLRFFSYFPLYVNLGGSLGNFVYLPKANSFLGGIIPFFWTKYNVDYEITGPVIIEIKPNYRDYVMGGFQFNVPVEFNIRKNKPLKYVIEDMGVEALRKQDEIFNKALNESLNKMNGTIKEGLGTSIVCNPSQRVSMPIYFNLTDPIKNSGIKDAYVFFNCKGIADCYIGKTDIGFNVKPNPYSLAFVNKTFFASRLPIDCYPGNLTIYKYGYKKVTIGNLNPNLESPINLGEIEMPSSKNLSVRIEKFENGNSYLNDKEYAIAIFESEDDKNFVRVIKQDGKERTKKTVLDFIPGKYKVTALLIYNDSIYIPPDEICYRKNFWSSKKCVDLPELNLSQWVMGQFKEIEFELNLSILKTSDNMIIRIPTQPPPHNYDELKSSLNVFEVEKLGDHNSEISLFP